MASWQDLQVDIAGDRLDKYLAKHLEDLSRTGAQKLIEDHKVLVNQQPVKASYLVELGDVISYSLELPTILEEVQGEDIPLDIVYEDEDLLVVNKARGMVVHPAAGHWEGTLVNALIHYLGQAYVQGQDPLRPGIVHRLDKDTTGLLLVAKNDPMRRLLSQMIKERQISRGYQALVWGRPASRSGLISAPLGRDPQDRKKIAVQDGGRPARTHFELLQSFAKGAELALRLETGRTHQIRVHLAYIQLPVVGDPSYGLARRETLGLSGQALHACRLAFRDPRTQKDLLFSAPAPSDYLRARQLLADLV
ncbi:MAG: RluA family pseudouridine synthase [Eubacteriales bacterium]|nr:RluA family pseudouridine synthase [Eubacteriales bacterium]